MQPDQLRSSPAAVISQFIEQMVDTSPLNSLGNPEEDRAFDQPLVGFSAGDDPLYAEFQRHIGDFFWTPEQAFSLAFPDLPAPASELSVISWILPHAEVTKAEQRQAKVYPSQRWARARQYGELFNIELRRQVAAALIQAGVPAVAPQLMPQWSLRESVDYSFASTWSERHAAYAAGLGTFSLSDGLITPRGKAMRTGSVIARLAVPPTPRPYQDHHAYCLFYAQGQCDDCIKKCPVGAISEKGHDKIKCELHTRHTATDYVKEHYGLKDDCCGLCQVGVPCESVNPTAD